MILNKCILHIWEEKKLTDHQFKTDITHEQESIRVQYNWTIILLGTNPMITALVGSLVVAGNWDGLIIDAMIVMSTHVFLQRSLNRRPVYPTSGSFIIVLCHLQPWNPHALLFIIGEESRRWPATSCRFLLVLTQWSWLARYI